LLVDKARLQHTLEGRLATPSDAVVDGGAQGCEHRP
jgi:hypothetical protein